MRDEEAEEKIGFLTISCFDQLHLLRYLQNLSKYLTERQLKPADSVTLRNGTSGYLANSFKRTPLPILSAQSHANWARSQGRPLDRGEYSQWPRQFQTMTLEEYATHDTGCKILFINLNFKTCKVSATFAGVV